MNSSHEEQRIVFAIRDFPPGCGTQALPNIGHHHHHSHVVAAPPKPREPDHHSDRLRIRNSITPPRSLTTAPRPKVPRHHSHVVAAPKPKSFDHHHHVVAAPPKLEEPNRRQLVAAPKLKAAPRPKVPGHHSHVVAAPKPKSLNHHHIVAPPPKLEEPHPSDRAKVLEVLRLYKDIFKQLEQEKMRSGDSYEGSSRIDLGTQTIIEQMGKQVNSHNRIGSVPGIKIGDEFQYKTELKIVGLHFKPWGGIDFMKIRGDVKIATSIVASEGYGYKDKVEDMNVMVYTGEGGNVVKNDEKRENQKMEKGNLALANSARERNVVRVIRGEERWDKKGKRYVYYGLYLVDTFWEERDVWGKTSYKFQLSRVPGQPPLT